VLDKQSGTRNRGFGAPSGWYQMLIPQSAFRNLDGMILSLLKRLGDLREGVKNSQVIELHETNHYVFIVDEALVVREMRKFLLGE
jgi:hypothetical protein